jgi:hypothetical protein
MKALDVAESAICGALYAGTGILIYHFLPITTPGVGIVRFWPNVAIPAVFAVLFGPLVGGFGAAIGIFLSDLVIHGDPLLSLSAGVTANFVGFYLIGYIARKNFDWKNVLIALTATVGVACVGLGYLLYIYVSLNAVILFISVIVASYIIAVVVGAVWPRWRSYGMGSVIGLGVGSTIIGLVVWAYSQFFMLPEAVGGGSQLPFYISFIWLVWVFATEIPFLIVLGPPLLKACYRAFPSLEPK